jgi:hypothetical protein
VKSDDLLAAGWRDVTGSFDERERLLDLARQGKAVIRRLHNGWFGKEIEPKISVDIPPSNPDCPA